MMCDKIELDGEEVSSDGRANSDRPGDPLFPIMPKILEALRSRNAERTAGQESDTEGEARDEYAIILESICGATDDSQPVEQYNGALGVTQAFVNANQRSVGQIQWNDNLGASFTNPGNVSGVRWCSGTLISNDLFLTAGHCFDQTGGGWERPRVNGTSNIISSEQIAQNMHVNFNFQVDPSGNPRPVSAFPIVALVEYRLGGLDFAIIRLGGNPGATWGQTPISTTDAIAGDMLCIMGHPVGVPKRIEAGPALAPSGTMIRYGDIDTQGGNSGSGVLRASDGRLVGVHTNGGCTAQSPNDGNANFGQRIAAVIAASPTLQQLTRPIPGGPFNTSIAQDILATIKGSDDQVTTAVARDVATLAAFDRINTTARLDLGGSLKFRDDIKLPVRDKPPFADIPVKPFGSDGFPGPDPLGPISDPGRFGGFVRPEQRPFVLSNPHHSMAWANEGQSSGLEDYEATLAQMTEVMTQYQQALQALEIQYQEVLAEYRQAGGQAG
jgi:V8-like Glu-specific endopeptidase